MSSSGKGTAGVLCLQLLLPAFCVCMCVHMSDSIHKWTGHLLIASSKLITICSPVETGRGIACPAPPGPLLSLQAVT